MNNNSGNNTNTNNNQPLPLTPTMESAKIINELYDGLSYFDLYGTSVMMFFLISFAVFLVCAYCSIMINVQPIKDDWMNERCNPKVMPFAGLINKPDDSTVTDFTAENFTYCIQNVLTEITGYAVQPITAMTDGLTDLYSSLADSVNAIRNMLAKIRSEIAAIVKQVLGKVLNVVTPLQVMFLALVDSMKKTQAVLVSGLYTSLGTYYMLQSLSGAIIEFIVKILVIMAALIAGLWILPVTWGAAAASTAVYLSISIPTAIIVATLSEVLHVHSSAIPKVCFDENTQLKMNDGTFKPIKEVRPGDVLENNNKITAKLTLSATDAKMYDLNGVLVSDSHLAKHEDNWLKVSKHPMAKVVTDYNKTNKYLHCLNTTSKTIIINDITFADWDELHGDTLNKFFRIPVHKTVKNEYNQWVKEETTIQTSENIHAYLDGGFSEFSMIRLNENKYVPISKILPDTILSAGDRVYGIVEIDAETLADARFYNLGGSLNVCGEINLAKNAKNVGKLSKTYEFNTISSTKKVFHLLTESGQFAIGTLVFNDYNYSIDKYFYITHN